MKYKNKHAETSKQNKLILLCGLVIFAASLLSMPQTLFLRYDALAFEEEEKGQGQHQGSKNGYITLFTTTNDNTTEDNSSVKYIENAAQLLNQVSAEYKKGNFTGAGELAIRAYLDNFEYVEPDLEKHGAKDLKEQIEDMMRVELRDMIKNKVSQDELDSQINATDLKLDEAMRKLIG
jgi:hypothetical protein